jgi:hypothetical protein
LSVCLSLSLSVCVLVCVCVCVCVCVRVYFLGTSFAIHAHGTRVFVCVYYCRTYYKAVRGGGRRRESSFLSFYYFYFFYCLGTSFAIHSLSSVPMIPVAESVAATADSHRDTRTRMAVQRISLSRDGSWPSQPRTRMAVHSNLLSAHGYLVTRKSK